jgi:hypothetical protein
MKRNAVMALGVLSLMVSVWFFFKELNYASTNKDCQYGAEMCLAEVLAWAGFGQILAFVAIIVIGTTIKEEKQ